MKYALALSMLIAAPAAAASDPPAWTYPIPPLQIAPNLYYVGTEGLASYLFVTPMGLILLDGTMAENVPAIEANIRSLGYKLSDVKVLLNSHAHFDHAGGLAALRRDTGAPLRAMAGDVWALEHGKHFGDQNYVGTFPAVKVDRVLHDGSMVTLGGMTLHAVATAGHTRGCTTWTTRLRYEGAMRDVVFPCSLSVAGNRLVGNRTYPAIARDYRASFKRMAAIPADIVLPAHPEQADVLGRRGADRLAPGLLRKIANEAEAAFELQLGKEQDATAP